MSSAGFPPSLRVPVSSVRFADTAYKSSIPNLNSDASHDRASGRVMHRYFFVYRESFRAAVFAPFRCRLTYLYPEFAPR